MKWFLTAFVIFSTNVSFSFNESGESKFVWASKKELLTDLSKNDLYFEYDKPKDQLSLKKWLERQKIIDSGSGLIVKENLKVKKPILGKVIKCVSECMIFRGEFQIGVKAGNLIFQGDTLETTKDGQLWVYLVDGTVARLSSNTSISFSEFKFNEESMLFFIRQNYGEAYVLMRDFENLPSQSGQESDLSFLPILSSRDMLKVFKADGHDLSSLRQRISRRKYNGVKSNYSHHIFFRGQKISSNILWVTPKGDYLAKEGEFHFIVGDLGSVRFWINADNSKVQLRGLKENDQDVERNSWYVFGENGESIEKDEKGNEIGWPMRLMTKNISSVLIKREELFAAYSKVYLNARYLTDLKYRLNYLSNEFLKRRVKFLKDFVRRSETIALKNRSQLKKSFGQKPFSWSSYYQDYHALDLYLQRLLVNNSLFEENNFEEVISPRNYLEKVKKQLAEAKRKFWAIME